MIYIFNLHVAAFPAAYRVQCIYLSIDTLFHSLCFLTEGYFYTIQATELIHPSNQV
jgi:hypothetical protein